LKEQLKQANPTKYAQENITEMVDDLKPVVEVLLSVIKFDSPEATLNQYQGEP
jgi:hypothetical protein